MSMAMFLTLFLFCNNFFTLTYAAVADSACLIGSTVTTGNVNCLGGDIFLKGTYVEVGIHYVGSYGTAGAAPSGFVSAGRQLGFIADYDKNGFASSSPGYAGDYFVPGAPVEGWILQWTSNTGSVNNYMMEGLMGNYGIIPTTFQITSTEQIQSALWVGTVGQIEVTKVTQFKNTDVYFSTTVTIKNIGTSTVSNLYYMRTVDPDQEQPYYGNFATRNYVQFQPYAADGSDCCHGRSYVSPTNGNTALVVAVGKNNFDFFCGLGTINPNARVSHWGFYEYDPVLAYGDASGDRQWTYYGGNDMQPTAAYSPRMYRADEAIHLTFKYLALAPGETVQLSYAYVLRTSDLYTAMSGLSAVTITQPTSDVSGTSARISVEIQNLTVTSVTFFVYGIKSSVSSTPAFYQVGAITGPSSSYAINFDSTTFTDGDVQIQVAVIAAQGNFPAYKASRISNLGVVMVYTISDNSGTYAFSNAKPTTLNMTVQNAALGNPDSISFYRESFANGQVVSLLIGTTTHAPWSVQVTCSDLAVGSSISVKASVSSSEGRYITSTVFNGIVSFVNTKPTDITLLLAYTNLNENTALGIVVGVFTTTDVDSNQPHTYSLLDSAGGKFSIVGSALTVAGAIDYETTTSLTILVRTNDGQTLNCCLDKSFTINIANINESPTSMSPLSITTPENAVVGTVLTTFTTIDQDVGQSFTYSLNIPSTTTALSSNGILSVTGTINYEITPTFTLLVRTTDNGSPNMYLDSIITVTVTNVNEAPTSIIISCSPCIVPENSAKGVIIGTLSTVDPDVGDTFTYSSTSTTPTSEYFAISSTGVVTVQNTLSYQSTGGSVSFTAKTIDAGGLMLTQTFTIVIQSVPSAPTSSSVTCYCDEDLRIGDIVSSATMTTPAFCQIQASTNNNAQLDYAIVSDQSLTGNYNGAFTVQSCSGVMIVNGTLDFETYSFYNLTIKVTSAGGISYSHVIIYLVNVNEAPVLSSTTLSVNENSLVGVVVTSSLASQTYDQDDLSPISAAPFCCAKIYSISSGNSDGFFSIIASTGAISVAKTGLNYEAKSSYSLIISVQDAGGLISTATFPLNVLDVNEAPSLPTSSGTYASVNENSAKGVRTGAGIVATDVDIGQTLSLDITGGNTNNAFNLTKIYSSITGITSYFFTILGTVDYETLNTYNLIVTATDDGTPSISVSSTYIVRINDINEAPTLPSTQSFYISENSPRYTLVGNTLRSVYTDPDAGSTATFSIVSYGSDSGKNFNIDSSSGQLFFDNTLLSYEKTSLFTYTVRVTDNGGLFTSTTVTINVNDIPEPPVYGTFITGYVTENVIGQYVRANNQEVEYVATDDDGDQLNFTVVSVNGVTSLSATSAFHVLPVSITSSNLYSSTSFDYETLKDYYVELQVTDKVYNVSKTLTVSVLDANDAPTVAATQNCYVAQNALQSTTICSIVGIDQDTTTTWSTLTYSLVDPVSGLGVSTTGNIGTLYLTADNTRPPDTVVNSILVRVTDGGGLSAIQTITLTITAVNFPPACPTTPFIFSVNENTPSETTIATLTGTNSATTITDSSPTDVTLSCTISGGNSDGKFSVTSGCILKTTSNLLDYEVKSTFTLTITAIENTPNPLTTSCSVAINVVDVNEATTLNDQTFYADENINAGKLTANSVAVAPVVVIDQDPADQHGLFSLVCIACGDDPISINQTTGILSLKSGKSLNYEVLNVYRYQVNWNSRSVSKQATVIININNLPEAPVSTSTSITIAESTVGSIGFVTAIDPDFAGTLDFTGGAICKDSCGLKYTLTGTTSGSFSIDVNTGAISLSSVSVDFEDADTYTLNVLVKDVGGLSSTCDITIIVTDVNDCAVTTITSQTGDLITSGSTSGGSQVFINGRNFGPTKNRMLVSSISSSAVTVSASLQSSSSASVSTYVFSMNCQVYRSTVYDNTLINCTLPAGIGKNLGVVVTVSATYGSSTKTCVTSFSSTYLSYAPPAVTQIVGGTLMPTTGGTSVILQGTNFGAKGASYNIVSATQSSSYFSASVSCSVTTAHTHMTCTSSSGIGGIVTWTAKVGGQTSAPLSGMSSFALPVISSISSSDLATSGGDTFTITGSNFGASISYVKVTYGPTLGTEYTSSCIFGTIHYTLQCTSAAGIGKSLKFLVTIGDQTNNLYSSTVKYQKPILTSVSGSGVSGASTSGGDIFFLSGSQFGPITESSTSLVVTYGRSGTEFVAEECKVVTSHTKVQCLTSTGTGINHIYYISVGTQLSVALRTNASYGPPTIASFAGDGASNALTNGYQTVYVSGTNFGQTMSTIDGVYYSEFNGTIFDATDNCTMYEAHRMLKCKTLPGAGKRLNWNVVVDGQLSVSPMTSYSPPTITSLSGPRVNNASVSGGDIITIRGSNFGPANAFELYSRSFLESVTYGPAGTEYEAANCTVLSNSIITCQTVPGVGGSLYWIVTVAGQSSGFSTTTMNYASPLISLISPSTASTDGKTKITLTGFHFAVDTLPKLYFGGKRITSFSEAENQLQFFVPAATAVVSEYYPVYIDVGGQLSNVVYFQYTPPEIVTLNSIDSGNNTLTLSILGTSFSLTPHVTIVPVDSDVPITPFCSKTLHTEIVCKISVRAGNVTIRTEVASSNTMFFQFGEPLLISSSLSSGLALTSGYTSQNRAQLYIVGQNFGASSVESIVAIENDEEGVTGECAIVAYTYVSKVDNPTEWNSLANQLKGFSYNSDIDFQYLTCNLPPGQGKLNSLKVIKGSVYSLGCGCELCSSSTCFSYLPPSVTSVTPQVGGTGGSYSVALRGSNFGQSRTVLIGDVEWSVVTSISNDTYVAVVAPPGEGINKKVLVQVGNQNTSTSVAKYFSYGAPVIDVFLSTLVVGTSGTLSPITITGRNFGVNGPIVYLNEQITILSFTHTTLTFNIPPGQGKGFRLSVNVSDQIGYSPDTFAYSPPFVTSASPLNCATNGGRETGVVLTLTGINFGFQHLDWTLQIGDYTVPSADIISYAETEVKFYPPAGQGENLEVKFLVGGQSYNGGPFYFSYDPPQILSLVTPFDKNTAGGYSISFHGLSFGTSGLVVELYDPLYFTTSTYYDISSTTVESSSSLFQNIPHATSSSRMPPTTCKVTEQTHSTASCTVPPGVGENLIFTFTVNGQSTSTNFSYSPPVVEYFHSSNGGDASGGETLKIYGRNFGSFRTPLNISIGDALCENSVWLADDPVYNYEPYLKCTTPATAVGTLNVTIAVAYQQSTPNDRYTVECKSGAFGGLGEYCTDCGDPAVTGLLCEYDNMYWPIAYDGWYMSLLSTPNTDCPTATQERPYCPAVLPCLPSKSCLGNNTCSKGYVDDRCATCDEGYYRINGRCEVCPNNPWLIFLVLFLCASTSGYTAYKLAQKNVNLGILSIGIDYFQVLAVFGSADVSWPSSLINLYNSLSVFNFNVDILAPDCWAESSLPYKTKWIGVTISPLIVLALITTFYVSYVIHMKIWKPQIKHHSEMLYKCVALYLMAFYYGYLMLSNNTLAIFNCQPTEPSDGNTYMAEVGPNGGICYESGSLQQELEPWAIIAFIVYTVGFPSFVAFVLYTNSDKCVYVQVMKAAGRSEGNEFEKITLIRFKLLYTRLFYQFKPEFYYWVFCILVRKFFLSVSAVIFRENVVFLLALYMLILFMSYTAQVTYQPYMSTSEYDAVAEKYAELISMYTRETTTRTTRGTKMNINRMGSGVPIFKLAAPKIEFFNNYNTVESTLLFSAIFVSISAIMFESNELNGSQRDALAYVVILVVSLSLLYFFWVLFTELWVAFYPTVPLLCIKPKKVEEAIDTDIEFADISYERQNPINDGADKAMEIVRLQTQLETAEAMISQMQLENNNLKKQRKTENMVTTGPPVSAPKKGKKKALSSLEGDEGIHPSVEMM